MKVGYARVSTAEQNLDMQIEALKKAGCEKIFTDRVSGTKSARLGLDQAIDFVRDGDTLVVWKLDRLGRSLTHLIDTVNQLENKGIGFQSLTEAIDTTTAGGKLVFHIFGALAEFERELIRERTKMGLMSAKAKGRMGGRPNKLTPQQVKMVKDMMASGNYKVNDICEQFGISRSTLYRNIKILEKSIADNT